MAHAAAHIKKARVVMEQEPDTKALEKARERRRRSRERAERKRKVRRRGGTVPRRGVACGIATAPVHPSIHPSSPSMLSSLSSSSSSSSTTLHKHTALFYLNPVLPAGTHLCHPALFPLMPPSCGAHTNSIPSAITSLVIHIIRPLCL